MRDAGVRAGVWVVSGFISFFLSFILFYFLYVFYFLRFRQIRERRSGQSGYLIIPFCVYSLNELVKHGHNGLVFSDADQLAYQLLVSYLACCHPSTTCQLTFLASCIPWIRGRRTLKAPLPLLSVLHTRARHYEDQHCEGVRAGEPLVRELERGGRSSVWRKASEGGLESFVLWETVLDAEHLGADER